MDVPLDQPVLRQYAVGVVREDLADLAHGVLREAGHPLPLTVLVFHHQPGNGVVHHLDAVGVAGPSLDRANPPVPVEPDGYDRSPESCITVGVTDWSSGRALSRANGEAEKVPRKDRGVTNRLRCALSGPERSR